MGRLSRRAYPDKAPRSATGQTLLGDGGISTGATRALISAAPMSQD
jgi:hypothetical protein